MLFDDYEIPQVLGKGDILSNFDKQHITNTILKETNATKEMAEKIALEVKRDVFLSKIKLITPPLLREMTNGMIIKLCVDLDDITREHYEKTRLEDTRIGFPRYDLKEFLKECEIKNIDIDTRNNIIANLVLDEYYAVEKLIKEKEEKINDYNKNINK